MEKIFYNLIENQNHFHPKLPSEIRIKGKSNTNSLRPESCPAIYEASSMGFVFFSETNFFFDKNCYSVNIYNTKNKKTPNKTINFGSIWFTIESLKTTKEDNIIIKPKLFKA